MYLNCLELVNWNIFIVVYNLIEGVIIVFVVFIIFLGNICVGFIVVLVILLVMLFVFIFMCIFGVIVNLMSFGVIDFGIVVDGFIVIVEGIFVYLYSNKLKGCILLGIEMDEEVEKGVLGVVCLVIFVVFIILIVFFFILILSGIEGKYFILMVKILVFCIIGVLFFFLIYVFMMVFFFLKYIIMVKFIFVDCFFEKFNVIY